MRDGKLTLTDIKRQNRTAKRQVAKAKRRVEKLRKLRTETFSLVDQLAKLASEEAILTDLYLDPQYLKSEPIG